MKGYEWIHDILIPHLDAEGRGEEEWALLILDPAVAHIHADTKELLKENRIALAMMPASTTYRFQMIDVVVGKPFKDYMSEEWAKWMINVCESRGITEAGNFRAPTPTDCNQWVVTAWEKVKSEAIIKKAKELGMQAEPGPPVEGYVDEFFEDMQPQGEEEEFGDEELWENLLKAAECEE